MTDQPKTMGEKNYEAFADRYVRIAETKGHNAYYDRPAVTAMLPEIAGLRILDAGCGGGYYSEWLLAHGAAHVTAVDVTPRMVELTAERLHAQGYTDDRFTVRRADLHERIDFLAAASVDVVVCALTLDYIDDWRKPFHEFYRVLRAPGTLVYSAGHPASDFFRYFSDGNYFDVETVRWLWKGFGEPHWVESYRRPLSEFINPLMETGFTLDTIHEPRPVEPMRATEPDHYDLLMRSPGFLVARAVKR